MTFYSHANNTTTIYSQAATLQFILSLLQGLLTTYYSMAMPFKHMCIQSFTPVRRSKKSCLKRRLSTSTNITQELHSHFCSIHLGLRLASLFSAGPRWSVSNSLSMKGDPAAFLQKLWDLIFKNKSWLPVGIFALLFVVLVGGGVAIVMSGSGPVPIGMFGLVVGAIFGCMTSAMICSRMQAPAEARQEATTIGAPRS